MITTKAQFCDAANEIQMEKGKRMKLRARKNSRLSIMLMK
jgi:hypothetical protein